MRGKGGEGGEVEGGRGEGRAHRALLLGMAPPRGTWALILLFMRWLGTGWTEWLMFSSDLDRSSACRRL